MTDRMIDLNTFKNDEEFIYSINQCNTAQSPEPTVDI